MRPEYSRLICLQGATIITGAISAYWIATPLAAKSLVYGGCTALLSTSFLAWRHRQEERRGSPDAGQTLRQAYRAAIERFVWVAAMLGAGFGLLELPPLWMLAGFVMGQTAWLLLPAWVNLRTKNDC